MAVAGRGQVRTRDTEVQHSTGVCHLFAGPCKCRAGVPKRHARCCSLLPRSGPGLGLDLGLWTSEDGRLWGRLSPPPPQLAGQAGEAISVPSPGLCLCDGAELRWAAPCGSQVGAPRWPASPLPTEDRSPNLGSGRHNPTGLPPTGPRDALRVRPADGEGVERGGHGTGGAACLR